MRYPPNARVGSGPIVVSRERRSGILVVWKAGPCPSPLREVRGQVAEPDSVGVTVRKHEQEGQLVVFRGGWADLEYWSGGASDEPVIEAPGWDDWMDLPRIERLLRRFADLFH
jgi:hypothetical protein